MQPLKGVLARSRMRENLKSGSVRGVGFHVIKGTTCLLDIEV